MSVLVGENIVDEIKSRCNIVDVIGRVVPLKQAGSNYKGICPFHNEKTPSFVVSDSKQIFSCFGCNTSGDVIGFVQKYYNLDFPEALEKLAEECGLEIQNTQAKGPKKEELLAINREAAKFFYYAFFKTQNQAFAYMKKRDFDPMLLKKFGVGYADGQWDSLYQHFQKLGIDIKILLSLGLISESRGKYYDKFRDRVIFPIINTNGKVIGFGGRALGEGIPKYLNSAESTVFLKKNNLFGLNLAKQDINKEDQVILVEGYMDVIALHQAGIRNVVASLGTALTENQARLLKRYTQNIVLSYDADEAGQAAALRGGEILHKEGCKTKIVKVSSGKDPDEFIKQNGRNAFVTLITQAPLYMDYKLGTIKAKHSTTSTEGKVAYIKEAVQFLRTLSPVEADAYIKSIAKDTKISENAITLEYTGNTIRQKREAVKIPDIKKSEEQTSHELSGLEKNLLKLALTGIGYVDQIVPYAHSFTSREGREIWEAIQANCGEEKTVNVQRLIDSLEPEINLVLQDILDNVRFAGKEEQIFTECVTKIEYDALLQKEEALIVKLSMVDGIESKEGICELTKELMEVQKSLQSMKR